MKLIYDENGENIGYVIGEDIFFKGEKEGYIKDKMIFDTKDRYLGKWTGTPEAGKIWDIGFDRFGYQIGYTRSNNKPNPIDKGKNLIFNNYGNIVGTCDTPIGGAVLLLLFFKERYPIGHRPVMQTTSDQPKMRVQGDSAPLLVKLKIVELKKRFLSLKQAFNSSLDFYLTQKRFESFKVMLNSFREFVNFDFDYKLRQWGEYKFEDEYIIKEKSGKSLMEEFMKNTNWTLLEKAFKPRVLGRDRLMLRLSELTAREAYSTFVKAAERTETDSNNSIEFWNKERSKVITYFHHDTEKSYIINYVRTPVALLGIPVDQNDSVWNWTGIIHEVGHDIYHNIRGFKNELKLTLYNYLKDRFATDTASLWYIWREQLFSDIFGVLFAGPAFTMSFQNEFLYSAGNLSAVWNAKKNRWDEHPLTYFRNKIQVRVLEKLGFKKISKTLYDRWASLYDELNFLQLDRDKVEIEDFSIPIEGILDIVLQKSFEALGNKRLVDIVKYSADDYRLTLNVARNLINGKPAGVDKARYIVCASRIAFENKPDRIENILKGINASVESIKE